MNIDKQKFSEPQKIFLWVFATALCFVALLAFDHSVPFEFFWSLLFIFSTFFALFKFINSKKKAADSDLSYLISGEGKIILRRRFNEDEPYATELFLYVSNGIFSGMTNFNCEVSDIKKIGEALVKFPQKLGDKYYYTHGSAHPYDSFFRYIQLYAYTVGATGMCALQFKIDLDLGQSNKNCCTFSLRTEPTAIARLGNLLIKFAELKHLECHWDNVSHNLFDELQNETHSLFPQIKT